MHADAQLGAAQSADSRASALSPREGRRTVQLWFWSGLGLALLAAAIVSHWPVRNGYFQVGDFLWLHIADWRSVADSVVGSQGVHGATAFLLAAAGRAFRLPLSLAAAAALLFVLAPLSGESVNLISGRTSLL